MAGQIVVSTISDGTNSTSSTNCIQGSAKAWVTFTGNGSAVFVAGYNVSSVTFNAAGIYTVNFTNALTDGKYTAAGICNGPADAYRHISFFYPLANTASSSKLLVYNASDNGPENAGTISVAFFR